MNWLWRGVSKGAHAHTHTHSHTQTHIQMQGRIVHWKLFTEPKLTSWWWKWVSRGGAILLSFLQLLFISCHFIFFSSSSSSSFSSSSSSSCSCSSSCSSSSCSSCSSSSSPSLWLLNLSFRFSSYVCSGLSLMILFAKSSNDLWSNCSIFVCIWASNFGL